MSIHLFADYYLDRDKLNWILQERKFSKKRGDYVLKNVAYFGNPKQLSDHIAQHAALHAAPDAVTLADLVDSIAALVAATNSNVSSKVA